MISNATRRLLRSPAALLSMLGHVALNCLRLLRRRERGEIAEGGCRPAGMLYFLAGRMLWIPDRCVVAS